MNKKAPEIPEKHTKTRLLIGIVLSSVVSNCYLPRPVIMDSPLIKMVEPICPAEDPVRPNIFVEECKK